MSDSSDSVEPDFGFGTNLGNVNWVDVDVASLDDHPPDVPSLKVSTLDPIVPDQPSCSTSYPADDVHDKTVLMDVPSLRGHLPDVPSLKVSILDPSFRDEPSCSTSYPENEDFDSSESGEWLTSSRVVNSPYVSRPQSANPLREISLNRRDNSERGAKQTFTYDDNRIMIDYLIRKRLISEANKLATWHDLNLSDDLSGRKTASCLVNYFRNYLRQNYRQFIYPTDRDSMSKFKALHEKLVQDAFNRKLALASKKKSI